MVPSLGSLVQWCCGEGGALQTDITGVWGEHSQCSGHTGFASRSRVHAFPIYTAQALRCSIWSGPCIACSSSFRVVHKSADLVGPAFCAFRSPSSSASQELDRCTLPSCSAPSPLRGPSLKFPCVLIGCTCLVSILGSWPLATTLPADVDHPESHKVFG